MARQPWTLTAAAAVAEGEGYTNQVLLDMLCIITCKACEAAGSVPDGTIPNGLRLQCREVVNMYSNFSVRLKIALKSGALRTVSCVHMQRKQREERQRHFQRST